MSPMSPPTYTYLAELFDYRSLGPSQQGGVSGEDMMSALEEFRRRRGVKEKVISDADTDSL